MEDNKRRRCCGIDVHKEKLVVCVLTADGDDGIHKEYGTFRNDLIRMRVWLKQLQVTDVAMESTGVYWRPVWNVLGGTWHCLALGESGASQGVAWAQERQNGIANESPSFCTTGGWTGALCLRWKFVSCGR